MRRFVGYRRQVPAHYVSAGYGNPPEEVQFEGVEFSDGSVVLRWMTEYRSTSVWKDFAEMWAVHGHADYGTEVRWLDEERRRPEQTDVFLTEHVTNPLALDAMFGAGEWVRHEGCPAARDAGQAYAYHHRHYHERRDELRELRRVSEG